MDNIVIKDRKKYYELYRMVDVFNSFYSLSGVGEKSIFDFDGKSYIAVTVNAVFSLEICFKFLYYLKHDSKHKHTHSLMKLYNSVKDDGLEEFLLTGFTHEEINYIMNEIDYAFDHFRYLYEYKSTLKISRVFLRDFTFNINSYCNEIFNNNAIKQFE